MKGRTYRYFNGPVIYPFGYGLSYTSFSFNNIRLDNNKIQAGDSTALFVDVKNTGSTEGDEVVQLYVKGNGLKNNDAIKSLKGFRRISLKPGETKTVEFEIGGEVLKRYIEGKGFEVTKGEHTLLIGSSSKNSDLKTINIYVE